MGKLRVYLETSFVSYLTGRGTANARIASDQAYTRRWWQDERGNCDVFVSEFTVDESKDGAKDQIERRMAALAGVPLASAEPLKVAELAKQLIDGHALPEGETTDALHIACAAVSGMDILLTWNCRHMANPHTLPITRKIVNAAGYACPAVMTPKTFIENTSMEVSDV